MQDDDTPVAPAGASTQAGSTDATDDETAAELSRAAREAVRQPADPRIDRQLARMGLTPAPEDAPAAPPTERQLARPARTDELEQLRVTLAAAQGSLDQARRRLGVLTWVVTLEGMAIAFLAVLLLSR